MTMQSDGTGVRGNGSLVALVPRINIQAFCETPRTAEDTRTAFADRRMARAHGTVITGGMSAAVRLYQTQSSPNLLIVESGAQRETLLSDLAALAEVCQPDTKVIVIGHVNDVVLYRELIRQGVSEYLVAPVAPLHLVETIASLYRSESAAPVGRVIAFVGARGGAGSSTLAHNCGWEMARMSDVETAIADLDLAYGTAALNFNIDASGGILEAISQPERVDSLLLDRLLTKVNPKLSLLCGPGGVDKDFIIEAHAVETILMAIRATLPQIVVDVPNLWAPWVRFTLLHADQIVITAEPELASLRNAKALVETLKPGRPNDHPPMVILNQVGIPKRPEISAVDFAKAVGVPVTMSIPFDPQSFGNALNNGRMVLEMAPRAKASEIMRRLAHDLTGDKAGRPATQSSPSLLKKFIALGKK